MKRSDSSEINPYILDEETRYKVNMSHFTLGEGKVREMHQRHFDRIDKVAKLAESLGVVYAPMLPAASDIIKRTEMVQKYHENKELYDDLLSKVLSVCTPEEVLAYINEQLNIPK